ncbi:MAG: glycosyltransferase family 4 protein [Thermoflexales bacterium]|nr:glycosyltransferase family 4 protein [Thermoflexales bacterium]
MRVGLIAYGLDTPARAGSGIGRYTLELARALAALQDRPEIVLLAAGGVAPLAAEIESRRVQQVSLPGCRLLPGLATLGNGFIPLLARRWNLDVIHDPTGVTPFLFGAGRAQTVVTVHDVFAWSCPGYSSLLDTMIYRYWLPYVLPRRGDGVITISDQSRGDIQRYLHVALDRLRVIPYGVSPHFRPLPHETVHQWLRRRWGLGRYVLFVGTLTLRKNIERALRAFARLNTQFPQLCFVLAGPRSWKQTPIEPVAQELGIADRLVLTGPLTDADLPTLYNGAELLIFPSLYEGFGLPPLEAMACGTPVVCSNAASLPEVVGDAAVTVDPYDVEGLAEAMRRVLNDVSLREDLRARGLERARQFTWEKAARETVEVYRKVLACKP